MKPKQIILAVLFTAASFAGKAQEKYEFMIMEYNTSYKMVNISIDGKEFLKDKAGPNHDKSGFNANPLLEKVSEYQDQNWELMNFNAAMAGQNANEEVYFAYLKRKKTEKK